MTRGRALAWWSAYALFLCAVGVAAMFRRWGGWPGLALCISTLVVGLFLESAVATGRLGARAVVKRTRMVAVFCVAACAVAGAWMWLVGSVIDDKASPWLHLLMLLGGTIVLGVPIGALARWLGLQPFASAGTAGGPLTRNN